MWGINFSLDRMGLRSISSLRFYLMEAPPMPSMLGLEVGFKSQAGRCWQAREEDVLQERTGAETELSWGAEVPQHPEIV